MGNHDLVVVMNNEIVDGQEYRIYSVQCTDLLRNQQQQPDIENLPVSI